MIGIGSLVCLGALPRGGGGGRGGCCEAYHLLGFLETEAGDGADLLDDLDLGSSIKAVQLYIELGLLCSWCSSCRLSCRTCCWLSCTHGLHLHAKVVWPQAKPHTQNLDQVCHLQEIEVDNFIHKAFDPRTAQFSGFGLILYEAVLWPSPACIVPVLWVCRS